MKTRPQAILLALVFLGSTLSPMTADASDISNSRYRTAFLYLNKMGVAKGFADGTVRPQHALNRAESLKMILAAHEKFHAPVAFHREHPKTLRLFKDVLKADWFSPLVETGFEYGLVTGYSDGTFRPGNTVRLSEGLAMLFRAQGISIGTTEPWYQGYMDKAHEKNLLSPMETWAADQYLTRGQFMDIVYRADKVRRENLVAFADPPSRNPSNDVASNYPSYVGSNYGNAYVTSDYRPTSASTSSAYVSPTTSQGSTTIAPTVQYTVSIPALGITDMLVTRPADPSNAQSQLSVLQYGVGHLFSLPGTNGKTLIYGHSSAYAWDKSSFTKIFREINRLKAGDIVTIKYNGKQYNYTVTHQEQVDPKDTSRYSTTGEELLLYTCWPPDSIATRLLVHAKPTGSVVLK